MKAFSGASHRRMITGAGLICWGQKFGAFSWDIFRAAVVFSHEGGRFRTGKPTLRKVRTSSVIPRYKIAKNKEEAPEIPDREWRDLGFQSDNPFTDFRGGGALSLKCMVWLAENFSSDTQRMVRESSGEKNYLWACACINVVVAVLWELVILNSHFGKSAHLLLTHFVVFACPSQKKKKSWWSNFSDKDKEVFFGDCFFLFLLGHN